MVGLHSMSITRSWLSSYQSWSELFAIILDKPSFNLAHGQRWVIYGRSGTGKTYTAVQLLSLYTRIKPKPYVILISPNAATDVTWKTASSEWSKRSRKPLVNKHFTSLTPEVSRYLIRKMKASVRTKRPVFLMVDDLGQDHTINRTWIDNPMRHISISARHMNWSVCMLYQSVDDTLKPLAVNADVIVSKELGGVQREKLRRMYLEDYTKEEFGEACDTAWRERYDTLIIDRTHAPDVRLWRNFNEEIKVRQDTSEFLAHFLSFLGDIVGSAKRLVGIGGTPPRNPEAAPETPAPALDDSSDSSLGIRFPFVDVGEGTPSMSSTSSGIPYNPDASFSLADSSTASERTVSISRSGDEAAALVNFINMQAQVGHHDIRANVATIAKGYNSATMRRPDPLGAHAMQSTYDPRSGRTYQNGPSTVSSSHGLMSNMREHSSGIYNTLEPYDPLLGVGKLRFIRGSIITWDSFFDPMRANLGYQSHVPGISDSGPDFSQINTEPHRIGLPHPGDTPITHRPERKEWPTSDERQVSGRGKLRI